MTEKRNTADWKAEGLHHWSVLALLHGASAPVVIDENLPNLPVDDRLAKVSQLLGLTGKQSITITGPPEVEPVVINHRLIDKMRDDTYAKRTPIIPWVPHAVTNAIEVWQRPVTSKNGATEARIYFLAPLAFAQENECYMAIAGEDAVVFNIIRADASYTNNVRNGKLLYAKDRSNCVSICCDRYLAMRSDLIRAKATVLELQQRNRKLRDQLKRA